MDYARLHSHESEQSVIGALLLSPEAADGIGALRPEHFFDAAHRTIIGQILAMIAAGQSVDAVTVAEELDAGGCDVGGLAYLGELAANTPSSRNIARYAATVVGKALERQLLSAADTIRETVSGVGSTAEKLAAAQAAVMSISESAASKAPRTMRDVLLSAVEVLERRQAGAVYGLPTGFTDLDRQLTGGMRPGSLIVVAGRPSMGKTALAINVAFRVAKAGQPALVLSMEMSEIGRASCWERV